MRTSDITPGIPRKTEVTILVKLNTKTTPVNEDVKLIAVSATIPDTAEPRNFFRNPGVLNAAIIIPIANAQTAIIMYVSILP